ncbi:carboxypeptidase-like regulatory domain-containing protein [Sinomicrobium sp. M5D2P17]
MLLLLPFSLYGVHAQSRLKGKVESTFSDVTGVHVINKTRESATITDAYGYFDIPTQEGDTILFSAVQYRKEEIVVTSEILAAPSFIIHLTEQVTELDEVVLKNLTGNLITDLRRIKTDSVTAIHMGLPNATKRLPTQTERRLNEATTGGGFIPLNPIINAISGRTRMLKKRLQLESETQKIEEIRNLLQDRIFIEFGIPEDKIYDFLHYCQGQGNYHHIKNNPDLIVLTDSLKRMARQYLLENRQSPIKTQP